MTAVPERTLPHSIEAEQSILGVVLVTHGKALDDLADQVRPEMFFRDSHQRIYRAMLAMYQRNEAIDFVTLHEALAKADTLDEVGGPAYIAALGNGVPVSTNIVFYARILREKAQQRSIIYTANKLLAAAYDQDDPATIIDAAERALLDLSAQAAPGDLVSADTMVREIYPVIASITAARRPVTGLATGFVELDRYTRGLQPGDLVLIGGRPSQGKSTIALQIALHVSRTVGPVAFFSLEMSNQAQTFRVLSRLAEVDGHRLQCGQMSALEQQRIGEVMAEFSGLRFWSDDTPALTAFQIRSRVRRLKARLGALSLVVIDYLQLMSHPKAERRDLEIGATSFLLKQIARELHVPIVVLCQLSRKVEDRPDKRPTLADLRESGSLEQDADVVLLISKPPVKHNEVVIEVPPTELIIAKQRNGPTTSIDLRFRGDVYRFDEVEGRG